MKTKGNMITMTAKNVRTTPKASNKLAGKPDNALNKERAKARKEKRMRTRTNRGEFLRR